MTRKSKFKSKNGYKMGDGISYHVMSTKRLSPYDGINRDIMVNVRGVKTFIQWIKIMFTSSKKSEIQTNKLKILMFCLCHFTSSAKVRIIFILFFIGLM